MATSNKQAQLVWLLLGALAGALLSAAGLGALQSHQWRLLHLTSRAAPAPARAVHTAHPQLQPPTMHCPPPTVCAHPQALLPLPWPAMLTDEDVGRAATYFGTGSRLRRVAAKLFAGQPIKAYALGGSVTLGVGSSGPDANYASRFFQVVNASYPHPGHVFANKGIGASGSGIFAACLERMLPWDTDLVVVEFSVNEPANEPFVSGARRRFEQLLRKLLMLGSNHTDPHKAGINANTTGTGAAVIVLHHYSWRTTSGDGVDEGVYYATSEAQLGVFANYYDMPQVSVRGLWPLMASGVEGFKTDKVTRPNVRRARGGTVPSAPKGEQAQFYYYDQMHPGDGGHIAMAEALLGPLRRALLFEHLRPPQGGNDGGIAIHASGPRAHQPLLPPMVPGNADVPTTLCAMQEEFQHVVARHSLGFEYRAEWPTKHTFVEQKWAWTGQQPGEWAELEFDSRDHVRVTNGTAKTIESNVALVYLRSYEQMGMALVECASGCRCRATAIDGSWPKRVSLMQHHSFKVTQHMRCVVRVTIQHKSPRANGDGHKVSLMALIVTAFPLHLGRLSNNYELAASHADRKSVV